MEHICLSFPQVHWRQVRSQRRAVYMSFRYMTPVFAEDLANLVGCSAMRTKLPPKEFLTEALRPPPVYFETDQAHYSGVCCVCFKKGCLGRCPNPECGLLMHHSCVPATEKGESLACPVCRTEVDLDAAENAKISSQELPYWHEVEVGAPGKRLKKKKASVLASLD